MNLKLESAGSIGMTNVGQHFEATTISEIAVVSHSVEKVYFLTICCCLEHAIFSEVIRWSFPLKSIVGQTVGVLFGRRLLLFSDEKNDLVVIARCYDPTCNGMKTGVTPQLGQHLTGVVGTLGYFGKRDWHGDKRVSG